MTIKTQRIQVGLFAAVTLGLVAVVLVVFGGIRFWKPADRYRVVFATSVIGLEPGAQVYMNGVRVGSVDTVGVTAGDLRSVTVAIKLAHGTPVHTDTRAMLQLAGITGLKVIDLRDGTSAAAALAQDGEIPVVPGALDKLEAQAHEIVDQSTALMKRANLLTDSLIAITDPAKLAASNLAAVSGRLLVMVDENRAALRDSLAAIRRTASAGTDLLDGPATQLLADAGEVVATLKKQVTTNEAPLRAAMFDFRDATRSLKELAREVRQRPSRLLFSSDPSDRKLP